MPGDLSGDRVTGRMPATSEVNHLRLEQSRVGETAEEYLKFFKGLVGGTRNSR